MRRRRRQPESAITGIGGGGFVRWKTSSSISPILFRFSSLWPFVLWFCFHVQVLNGIPPTEDYSFAKYNKVWFQRSTC
ncbi:hypothetical protein P8452_26835 [Trifolium repens]|nr:hypothetical protein P8452_26835 [Trifolium repens]